MEQAVISSIASVPGVSTFLNAGVLEALRIATRQPFAEESPEEASRDFARAVLDHVQFGVLVVDQRFDVRFANSSATRECDRHPVLRLDRGRLLLVDPAQRSELQHAVGATQTGRWSLVSVGKEADRIMLAVLPLGSGEPGQPALLVFGLRTGCKPLAIQFYAQACRLSPAETSVLLGLNEGLAPREIARRHGVAISTVRSQIGSIRHKTGTRSIVDLVRTLGCLPPIMPAAMCAI